MGSEVSMSEGFIVTIVSMLVVFAVLVLISFLIGLLRKFSEEKEVTVISPMESVYESVFLERENTEKPNEELVAVIAAALAASLGLDIPNINIKSIKRIQQNSSTWSEMGKIEQLSGKL